MKQSCAHHLSGVVGVVLVSVAAILLPVLGAPSSAEAQTKQVYMDPPPELAKIVDTPPTPTISVSPDRSLLLVITRPGLPGIDEVSQPELRLAGLRINPRNFGPSRSRYNDGLSLLKIEDRTERTVTGFPTHPKITNIEWSPDGTRVAAVLTFGDRLELWTVNVKSARARRLIDRPINSTYSNPYAWMPNGKALIVATVPEETAEAPQPPAVPGGPVIQQSLGRKAPARTYQDLLSNKHDEAVFEHYATAQLMIVSIDGSAEPIGQASLIDRFSPSPDGRLILVQKTSKPFSYTVPAYRFPAEIEVWNSRGNLIHTVAKLPLADDVPIPFGSVRKGARSVQWRADTHATLMWVEALDGGDAGGDAQLRDRLFLHDAPFDSAPRAVLDLDHRFREIYWGTDELALAAGFWWQTRNVKVWKFAPGDPSISPSVTMEYSYEDRYNDPGRPLLRPSAQGNDVLVTDRSKSAVFLSGRGGSLEGDRPFVDRLTVADGKKTCIFRSQAPHYDQPVALLDPDEPTLLYSREAKDLEPNYWVTNLEEGTERQVTAFPNPNPQFAGVQKELIRYIREDGVELSAKLYLPAGYDAERDGPLPMMMWAYPREFKSASAASQVVGSPHRFVRVTYWSPTVWLLRGYAVLEGPTMPIVGEAEEEPNDTFRTQLVASAKAAVDEVVRRGVADPERICIGGHSYGAFMTGNLLAHSDLFRAGIARSGAYNRTLTPFGFQAEERTVWQAPEIYFAMSPFMHAEKINEPILLIHGDSDNNSGTYPLQSRRFYSALKGLGATVRLCMLPHESHGYRARESLAHMLWEMSEWLDRYVKNAESLRGNE